MIYTCSLESGRVLFGLASFALLVSRAIFGLSSAAAGTQDPDAQCPRADDATENENTEPKPILKVDRKRDTTRTFSAVQGIALFSPNGDASGTAVLSKGGTDHSELSAF